MLKHKIFNILLLVLIYGLSLPAWGAPTVQRRKKSVSGTHPDTWEWRPDSFASGEASWNHWPSSSTLVCSCVRCNQDGYTIAPVQFTTNMPLSASEDHDGMCMHDLSYMPVIPGDWKCNGGAAYIAPSCP